MESDDLSLYLVKTTENIQIESLKWRTEIESRIGEIASSTVDKTVLLDTLEGVLEHLNIQDLLNTTVKDWASTEAPQYPPKIPQTQSDHLLRELVLLMANIIQRESLDGH